MWSLGRHASCVPTQALSRCFGKIMIVRTHKQVLFWFVIISIFVTLSCFGLAQPKRQTLRKPDVPIVISVDEVVDAMLKTAEVSEADVVYDLGCGDGRIVITAAVKYGARGVGVDINPQRIKESRLNARKA